MPKEGINLFLNETNDSKRDKKEDSQLLVRIYLLEMTFVTFAEHL